MLLAAFEQELKTGAEDSPSNASEPPSISCLYKLYYEQPRGGDENVASVQESVDASASAVFRFPPLPVDLTVQDASLGAVRDAWQRVVGTEADDAAYMAFDDREGYDGEGIEYD